MSNFNMEDVLKTLAIKLLGFAACGLNINAAKNKYKELLNSEGVSEDDIDKLIDTKCKWYKNRLFTIGFIGVFIGYLIRHFLNDTILNSFEIVLMYSGFALVTIQMCVGLNFGDVRPTSMADLIRKRK